MKYFYLLSILLFLHSCSTQEGVLATQGLSQIQISESNKQSAQVFLNKQSVGHLNEGFLLLDSVPTGSHTIALFSKGYLIQEKEVLIQKGQALELGFKLQSTSSGHIQVQTKTGDQVFINSYDFGKVDSTGIFLIEGIQTGQHSLTIQNGNHTSTTPVQISTDLTTYISPDLSLEPRVLIEHISNVGCISCPGHTAVLHHLLDSLNLRSISKISYHANWPFKEDPLYLADPEHQKERALFYGAKVNYAIPIFTVNGTVLEFKADNEKLYQLLSQAIDQELQKVPLFDIQINTNQLNIYSSDSVPFEGTLHLNLTQNKTQFTSPPGSNQETIFLNIHKQKILHKNVQLKPNNTQSFPFEAQLNQLNPQGLTLTAFIQNPQGQILQSTSIPFIPN